MSNAGSLMRFRSGVSDMRPNLKVINENAADLEDYSRKISRLDQMLLEKDRDRRISMPLVERRDMAAVNKRLSVL
jgi:hypothetical protein